MIDGLPDLYQASDNIVNLFRPQNSRPEQLQRLAKDLQDPNSRTSKNYSKYRKAYADVRDRYGNEPYINVANALKEILGVRRTAEVGEGEWRPDDILYCANLATVLETSSSPSGELPVEKLDRFFPEAFLGRIATPLGKHAPGDSRLLKDTFDVGLDLRTQVAITFCESKAGEEGFSFETALGEIFFDLDQDNNSTKLKGWAVDGLWGDSLKLAQRNAMSARLKNIRNYVMEGVADLQALHEAFPSAAFHEKLLNWIRLRLDEIEARIKANGGVERVQEMIEDEIARRKAVASQDSVDYPDLAQPQQSQQEIQVPASSAPTKDTKARTDAANASSK